MCVCAVFALEFDMDYSWIAGKGKFNFVVDVLSFCMFLYGFGMKAAMLI